jgi:hypothetical protein
MKTEDLSQNPENQLSAVEPQQDISLSNCTPSGLQPQSAPASDGKIRRSRRDEAFTTAGESKQIACLVDKRRDTWGNLSGEDYYPVIGNLQSQMGAIIRSIAFNPCVTASGATFIYPQKLDQPQALVNSWNASLAEALSLDHGLWRTIRSDKAAQCYQYEVVPASNETKREYPEFLDDLEQALTPNIITSLDHPVAQRILAEQQSVLGEEDVY